jgi:predicted permease
MTAEHAEAYYRDALARVRAVPGVEAASFASTAPLNRASRRGVRVPGYEPRPGEGMELPVNTIEPSYFDTLQVTFLAGRRFDERDTASSARVVIVNDLVVSRFFKGDAVGRRIRDSRDIEHQIVGVVRAGVYLSVQEPPAPMLYYPLAQEAPSRMVLVARTGVAPATLVQPIRRELQLADGGVAVFRTTTMEGQIGEMLAGDRLTASLVSACGLMALALAMIGVYGVVGYSVALRAREIGVRVALGARPVHVARLVLTEGLTLIGAGALVGALAALVATRVLRSMLYLVSPADVSTFAGVPVALGLVGLLAAWLPMRRALRLDPITVLRQE